MGGLKVGTKSERLFDKDPPQEAARWVDSIAQLEEKGLIRDRNGNAEVYWLTTKGFEATDLLKSQV
jgi:hypothetical protein